ncbi:unnamed protein product [Protopolystoma xenopodis]|uniref:Uncharacterized protein n=1 Tax=Protopolystoma xenopodis TaxID=117903 RepID=A0A448WNH8_9PLAT|nr:unnamed protein product [Protopolystoma xenopodis]
MLCPLESESYSNVPGARLRNFTQRFMALVMGDDKVPPVNVEKENKTRTLRSVFNQMLHSCIESIGDPAADLCSQALQVDIDK